MITARLFFICLFCCAVVRTTDAHNDGGKHDHDHRLHQHDHKGRDDDRQLGIGDDFTTLIASNSSKSRGPCKDGEPSFTVGQVTFQCLADFHQNGQMCGTPIMSPEEEAKAVEDFQAWKMMKANYIMQLEAGVAIAGSVMAIDWSNPSTVITIPTYFHMIHSGNSGKQFTYASNPSYIQNQIKALNIGFQGENSAYSPSPNGRSYERYSITNADARIRFCLAGTTATDNASWYTVSYGSSAERAMKTALKKGGMETLNVYVGNLGNGLLGWSNFPNTVSAVLDGVVLLNESMPGGAPGPYNQGDSLTHEIGHWLSLWHTFQNGCLGAGDYMDLAPPSADYTKIAAKEKNPSYGCPVGLNDCTNDSGKKNPIHSFMSYVDVRFLSEGVHCFSTSKLTIYPFFALCC